MAPVLAGLLVAAPLICVSSSSALGRWLRNRGIFLSPVETEPPPLLHRLSRLLEAPKGFTRAEARPLGRHVPVELYSEMPVQQLSGPTRTKPRREWARSGGH